MTGFEYFLQQLALGLAWGSIYALIALGYTMVYGVLRLINFAHGDVFMVGAYASLLLVVSVGLGAAPAVLVAMLVCAALGLLIERGAYRPLRRQPRLTMLITAIGVSLLLEYGGQLSFVFGATPRAFPVSAFAQLPVMAGLHRIAAALKNHLHIYVSSVELLAMFASVLLMVGLHLFVLKTRVGRAIRAVSFDPTAAGLMGINIDRIIALTFALGSALAAAAAVLYSLKAPQLDPLMGLMPGIKAFVAAVLGGIGNIPGALCGGLVMGVAEYMVAGYISSSYRDAIAFFVLILILLVKPTGLTGKGRVEKL